MFVSVPHRSWAGILPSYVSMAACLYMLCRLLYVRTHVRQRLFWQQLLALTIISLCWAVLGEVFPLIHPDCMIAIGVRHALEYACCLVELQIAAGFAMACAHVHRSEAYLRWSMFASVPVGFLMVLLFDKLERAFPAIAQFPGCFPQHTILWDIFMLSSIVVAGTLYATGARNLSEAPRRVRRQARKRGVISAFVFCFTFAPKAFFDLLGLLERGHIVHTITLVLFSLNGGVNILVYELVFRKERRSRAKSVAYRVAFAEDAVAHDVLLVDPEPDEDEPAPCRIHGHSPRRRCRRCQAWVQFINSGVQAPVAQPCQRHDPDDPCEGCQGCGDWMDFVASVAREIEAWQEGEDEGDGVELEPPLRQSVSVQ